MRRSRLLSVLAGGTLAITPMTGPSLAEPFKESPTEGPLPALRQVEAQDDSDGDERMRESCEEMHQEMMRGMDGDMGRMRDDMVGGMDGGEMGGMHDDMMGGMHER